MRIGELARTAGVNTKTIRYYEEVGVLPEARRADNGYRVYDEEAVDQLRFVRDAQASGLTLDEIASIIGLRRRGASTCGHVLALLSDHLRDLDEHIAVLHKTREELAALIERGESLDPTECTDPIRCQTIDAAREVGAPPGLRFSAHEH